MGGDHKIKFSHNLVLYIRLQVQCLYQGRIEKAVLVQDVSNHAQSPTAQVSLFHQVFLK